MLSTLFSRIHIDDSNNDIVHAQNTNGTWNVYTINREEAISIEQSYANIHRDDTIPYTVDYC